MKRLIYAIRLFLVIHDWQTAWQFSGILYNGFKTQHKRGVQAI